MTPLGNLVSRGHSYMSPASMINIHRISRILLWLDAFPDIELTLHSVVADKDHSAFRFTFLGRHEGDFQDIAPTGNAVEVTGMIYISIDDGLIDGLWYEWDELGFFEQLGVLEHPLT